jgi:hypothetical protein
MTATVGIDLASRPAGTAVCAIEWAPQPTVAVLTRGVVDYGSQAPLDDKQVLSIMCADHGLLPEGVSKIAIDAPFGWPVAFVDALSGDADWPEADVGIDPGLVHRRTDRWIRSRTGKVPLSVSTDRIAYPAMRLASLFTHYNARRENPVDRTGRTGPFCEAYPDPSIRAFDLWPDGVKRNASYKRDGGTAVRQAIMGRLQERAPWLAVTDAQSEACVESNDMLDALICALVARAAERPGLVHPIPPEAEDDAQREGWIHLPIDGALDRLR